MHSDWLFSCNDRALFSCNDQAILARCPTPIRNKLCLNEGLLKTEQEPHGITKTSHGRMRALDTAESNAITT